MSFIPVVEVLFLVVYALLLWAVGPYVMKPSEEYGSLIPATIALTTGALLWSVLTWVGMSHTDGWIWAIVLVAMPVAMGFGAKYFLKARLAGKL